MVVIPGVKPPRGGVCAALMRSAFAVARRALSR